MTAGPACVSLGVFAISNPADRATWPSSAVQRCS
jgi:hypothetical protein